MTHVDFAISQLSGTTLWKKAHIASCATDSTNYVVVADFLCFILLLSFHILYIILCSFSLLYFSRNMRSAKTEV